MLNVNLLILASVIMSLGDFVVKLLILAALMSVQELKLRCKPI